MYTATRYEIVFTNFFKSNVFVLHTDKSSASLFEHRSEQCGIVNYKVRLISEAIS